jgi:ankyrin repeat protein
MAASAAGNINIIRDLLRYGASVNVQNVDGHTALMFAYNGKNQEETLLKNYKEYVIENASNDNEGDGQTIREDAIKAAAVSGGDEHDKDKIMLLIEEAIRSHKDLISLLIESGADPNIQVRI